MPGPEFQNADQNIELEALRELVDTILLADYRDRNGVGLLNNIAFLNAQTIVELNEALRNGKR